MERRERSVGGDCERRMVRNVDGEECTRGMCSVSERLDYFVDEIPRLFSGEIFPTDRS